ncbi:MAG: hypothetical protein RQ731_00235 [Anaerosomatales bacterium]|nr:hypothetical protein [Anaerosomatales bacterium]MDT8433180.1 hypothetical protein [Anaerosomatales bacterium]
MRRTVAVLIVALLALTLVACGGGASDEPEAAPDTGAAAPPPPPVDEAVDLSPLEEQVYEPFPVDSELGAPDAILSRLEAGQPMIIVFYDDSQKTTDDQEDIIRSVTETYRGLIDVVSFNLGAYVTQDARGTITVQPGLADDETAKQVTRMIDADHLDIRFTPFVLIVDDQGYVTWRHRGISDDKTLEREVLRVTE